MTESNVYTIPTHAQTTTSNLTTVTSHHDGWKTNTLPLVYGLEITTCRYKGLLQELVLLCYGFPVTQVPACNAKVFSWLEPLLHLVDQITFCVFPHTTEQDSQPTTSLISKQAIPYHIRGDTCCSVVSTPKTQSLADLSMTNRNTWCNPTVSTIPTHAQTTVSNLTTVISHHDRWKTNTLNIQHKSNSIS
jgi:hypothetical protein